MDSKCPRVSGETHRQLVPQEGFLALLGQTSTPNTNWFTVRIPSLSANHWKFTDALSSPSVSCRMKENIDKIVFAASSIIKGVRSSLLTSPLLSPPPSSLVSPPPQVCRLLQLVVSRMQLSGPSSLVPLALVLVCLVPQPAQGQGEYRRGPPGSD